MPKRIELQLKLTIFWQILQSKYGVGFWGGGIGVVGSQEREKKLEK